MSVNVDPSGHRSVQVETEVPGTPEQVWAAIATGPGISSWFVPSEVEEQVGGVTVSHFSPDGTMDSVATIEKWEPPHQFVATSDEMGCGPVATEWTVEAQSGSTCVVRVVHRWYAETDEWDNQFIGFTYGWPGFFRILRLYLRDFAGEAGRLVQLSAFAPEPLPDAWSRLVDPLGLGEVEVGQHFHSPEDVPALAGKVESVGVEIAPERLITLERPVKGIAHLFPMPMGGQIYLSMRFYVFGDASGAQAAETEAAWKTWLEALFPAPEDGGAV